MGTALLAASALIAAFSLLVGAVVAAVRVLSMSPPHARGAHEADTGLASRVEALETAVRGLPSLWEAERARAEEANDRAKKRLASARAAESRARREREEDEDGEPDDDWGGDQTVLGFDGAGSGNGGLQPVSEVLERSTADDVARWAQAQGLI